MRRVSQPVVTAKDELRLRDWSQRTGTLGFDYSCAADPNAGFDTADLKDAKALLDELEN
jgi:hypothetical protein